MLSLIAIDPGLSTGVAQFGSKGELLSSFTSTPPNDRLRLFLQVVPDAVIVCEQGPSFSRRQQEACEPVEALVRASPPDVHWIRPTTWKPSPAAKLLSSDNPSTKHEKDAIRLGRWFLEHRKELLDE